MKKRNAPAGYSICLNCGRATNPDVCSWAKDNTPVKGWKATPTVVGNVYKFDSFRVEDCPLFIPDAENGGLEEGIFGSRRVRIDKDDTVSLASAICVRAVEDWKFLGNGAIVSVPYYGSRLHREELLQFFFGEWFARLLASFSERTPEQIRSLLGITESMRPNMEGGDRYPNG